MSNKKYVFKGTSANPLVKYRYIQREEKIIWNM